MILFLHPLLDRHVGQDGPIWIPLVGIGKEPPELRIIHHADFSGGGEYGNDLLGEVDWSTGLTLWEHNGYMLGESVSICHPDAIGVKDEGNAEEKHIGHDELLHGDLLTENGDSKSSPVYWYIGNSSPLC